MMRKNALLLPVLGMFMFLSVQCHKDNPRPDYIRLVHNKEIATTGRGGKLALPLDVDDDGTADFEFRLDSWSQLSGAGWSRASVAGIHGTFEFNTTTTRDTTFQSDSYDVQDGSYWNKKVAVIDTRTLSCRRLKTDDIVLSTGETRRVNSFRPGDLKSPKGDWSSDEVFFHEGSGQSTFLYEQKQNSDTIWFLTNYLKEINDCQVFPSDTVCIWIRYTVDGLPRPGWIRLVAAPGHISILDSEIQK